MAYDEKAVVKIDGDGNLLKCAKGLGDSECGYTPGAKVCGKCGAMSVSMKEMPMDDEEMPKKKPATVIASEDDMDEEDMPIDDEEMAKGWGKKKRGMMMKAGEEEEMDDEEDTPETEMNPAADAEEDMAEGEEDDEEEDDEEIPSEKSLAKYRQARLSNLQVKSAEIAANGYLCQIDRKVYPGSTDTCDDCLGGCTKGKGLPFGLLEVEGMVEAQFKGQIVDSGYSDIGNMYVVDVVTKSDRVLEVYVDGSTAEVRGMIVLDEEVLQQKSLNEEIVSYIDFAEAADIALKSVPGNLRGVEPEMWNGVDCYVVEIDGLDGKSWDVYVSLDGVEIGQEWLDADEAADIEAEAAEIALKREFSEDKRQQMAKEGMALPDGSFPIATVGDLQNAIMAFGRAKDKEKAKAHIMKRARALDAADMIPENWMGGEKSADDGEFMRALAEFELLADDEFNN